MTTKPPVVRQTSWVMVIPQLIVMLVFVGVSVALFWSRLGLFAVSLGAVFFLIYSVVARTLLTRHHRKGMDLTRREEYPQAISEFEQSYEFFRKNAWVDQYRAVTMMTPAAMPFREMALINIGYCQRKMGENRKAKATYERVLQEFPDSVMARSGLEAIAAKSQMPTSET
jgi:tetratricopeptide (TPR) repeat protein